jgi:hypothetical protein
MRWLSRIINAVSSLFSAIPRAPLNPFSAKVTTAPSVVLTRTTLSYVVTTQLPGTYGYNLCITNNGTFLYVVT